MEVCASVMSAMVMSLVGCLRVEHFYSSAVLIDRFGLASGESTMSAHSALLLSSSCE